LESNEVMVSVCCLAYNHEPYIRKCLDGFVMQKTSFKYEVLIHDDASTDRTADIIREYQRKYPDVIKPIYQSENQYSKGISILKKYQYPRVNGKYIAFCEGDDYWTDELKLQKQVDFLENNTDYSMCVHQVTSHNCRTGKEENYTDQEKDKEYTKIEEIVRGTGCIFATNSIMILKTIPISMPECFTAKGFGDFQLLVYGIIVGKCYYIAESMSVYNWKTPGSWSTKIQDNNQFLINHLKELIAMLERVNEYYEFEYDHIFKKIILNAEYIIYIHSGNIRLIHDRLYRDFYLEDLNNGRNPTLSCLRYKFRELYHCYSIIKERLINEKK